MSNVTKDQLLEKVAFINTAKATITRAANAVKSNSSVTKAAGKLKGAISAVKANPTVGKAADVIKKNEKLASGAAGLGVGHVTGKLTSKKEK